MRAIRQHVLGGPEVLELVEVARPSPPPTENFDAVPVFTRGPHEYQDVPEELSKVGHAS